MPVTPSSWPPAYSGCGAASPPENHSPRRNLFMRRNATENTALVNAIARKIRFVDSSRKLAAACAHKPKTSVRPKNARPILRFRRASCSESTAAPRSKPFTIANLRQDFFHHVPVHVGQPVIPALKFERQLRVVDSQAVKQRGVQVVDVDRVLGDVVAVIVGDAE